jgi:hypothetical protein
MRRAPWHRPHRRRPQVHVLGVPAATVHGTGATLACLWLVLILGMVFTSLALHGV